MFVKTKNAIWDLNNENPAWKEIALENAISQSENIEDLFDKVIYVNEGDIIDAKASRMKVYHITEMQSYEYKVYGAIWVDTNTKPTLKSVAKYENGEWVLL